MSGVEPVLTTGVEKAAILVVLLGDEVGSQLYSHLPGAQWRDVTRKVAELDTISPDIAASVLDEYYQLSARKGRQIQGGREYAEKVLTRAFGEHEAENLMDNFVFAEDETAKHFSALQEAEPARLATCLETEHPQTIALVLAQLGSKAARVLKHLGDETRVQVVERLAGLRQASPEMIRKISGMISSRLGPVEEKKESRSPAGGARAVATLLNRLDPETGKTILEAIRERDEELATEIADLMFIFEDFLAVPVAGIRDIVGQVDKQTLALALGKASEKLQNHFFGSMSSRAVVMMKEDMEVMGDSAAADITAAQKEIIGIARQAEADGRITLRPPQDEEDV